MSIVRQLVQPLHINNTLIIIIIYLFLNVTVFGFLIQKELAYNNNDNHNVLIVCPTNFL